MMEGGDQTPLVVDGHALDWVSECAYLGSVVSKSGGYDREVKVRVGKATQVFGAFQKALWRDAAVPRVVKLRAFFSIMVPTLFYGCACWAVTESDILPLRAFYMRCLWRLADVHYCDRVTTAEVVPSVEDLLRHVRLNWVEYLGGWDLNVYRGSCSMFSLFKGAGALAE